MPRSSPKKLMNVTFITNRRGREPAGRRAGSWRGTGGEPAGTAGGWLVRVLQHQVADLRERGLDVLGGAAADGAVCLDDHGPAGGRGTGIGHREHRLGHLIAAPAQAVAPVGSAGSVEVGPEP